jgi:hypothetical protein
VAVVEVAREGDLDPLADPERAVRLDVDRDVRGEEREVVGSRDSREGECARRASQERGEP